VIGASACISSRETKAVSFILVSAENHLTTALPPPALPRLLLHALALSRQCWYFDAGPGGLAIEASKTVHAATIQLRRRPSAKGDEPVGAGVVEVHTLDGYPIRTLVRVMCTTRGRWGWSGRSCGGGGSRCVGDVTAGSQTP